MTDDTGGVLPGVTVSVSGPALQVPQLTDVTRKNGTYRLVNLPPGVYRIAYELVGFQTIVHEEEVRLNAGDQANAHSATVEESSHVRQGAQALPLVVVLATGGTIAGRSNGPSLTGKELVDRVPALAKIARTHAEDVSRISSLEMTPEIWLALSKRVNEFLAKPEVTGVVVTHGTDTLEETAYFLDLTAKGSKPVVVVGAQRNSSEPDSDGPRNLLDAVRVAVSPEAIGKGAMVVMNGQIHAAREVSKTHTLGVETFRSLEFGQLGYADLESVRFYRAPARRQTIPLDGETRLGRVEIVAYYAGADGRVIRGLLSQGPLDGLVIAGTGTGNVGQAMYGIVKQEVRARGIPVVISTRVYTGRTIARGGRLSLKELGCVFADNLSPQKARVLLMVALTKTNDPKELQKYFDR